MQIKAVKKIEWILNSYVKFGDKILDIGCGTGAYRSSTQGRYFGLDMTNEDYSNGNPRCVDIVASAAQIPIEKDYFDLVFCVSSFYLIPDFEKALKEFYRVLKPGGRLILFDYNRKTQLYLSDRERKKYPAWTQSELKTIVQNMGFRECEILLLLKYQFPMIIRKFVIDYNEYRLGGRAIVTGIK